MSNFTVSARKYRPGTFDSVVGQAHITQTLKNAIRKDHLGHAFLFCGPRGVGKTTCARILAKTLNCESLTSDTEPCGECASCQAFSNQQSFNIYELDAASNNSVDDIRNLNEQVRFAPQSGKYKIYIIDEVHMLSTAAFNAFLKTLEEPPSYAIFILATTEKHKILPTILSRCQVFDFHRITIKEAIGQLKAICKNENIEAEEEALYVIAQKADGALRDALSIFDRIVSFSGERITYKDVIENLNVLDYDYYFKVTDLILSQDLPKAMLLFDEILNKGFDGHNFLTGLSEHLRNLLVCRDAATIKLLELSEGTQQRYFDQAKKSDLSFLLSGLSILNQFDVNYKSSKNQRLHVELALMKLCFLPNVLNLEKLPATDFESEVKKKSTPEPAIVAEPAPRVETSPRVETPAPVASVSAPAPVKEVIRPKTTAPVGKLSLDALRSKYANRPEVTVDEEVTLTDTIPAAEIKPIDLETFRQAWDGYVQDIRKRGKSGIAAALKDTSIEMAESGVRISLTNDGLRNQLEEDKFNMQDYMREAHSIQIPVEYIFKPLEDGEIKKYMFSDADRFEKMAETYPILKDFQKRLGLRL
jgi:DNA polymerase-3 subunit gamma/tau